MALVDVDAVAVRLGLDPGTLTTLQTAQIAAAIADSEAKVQSYLGRPLAVETEVVEDLFPLPGYDLTDYRCWPQVEQRFGDRYEVSGTPVVAASGVAGCYDVTFAVGIDVAGDAEFTPILTFIAQDAAAALRENPAFVGVSRLVTNVSADGQSISYARAGGPDQAGGQVNLALINRWRRRAAYQRPSGYFAPWPYV